MKFAAAAITPGRAKVCQNGTEPSAKSIQSVPFCGMPHVSAAARCGAAANPAQSARAMSNSLFMTLTQGSSAGGELTPRATCPSLLAVERRVHLGHSLGLAGLVPGLRVSVDLRLAP